MATYELSDGLKCFQGVVDSVAAHDPIIVGTGRQSVMHPEFRRVNTVLSNLKTAISGT